jgi:hypothetical protein
VRFVSIDVALNLLWLAITTAALIWFARAEAKRSGRIRWHRLFAVLLATVALFPTVSDSDDLFSFSLLQAAGQQQGAGAPEDARERNSVQLARLLETLDHFQISAVYQVSIALCFVALLLTLSLAVFSRPVFASCGRAPPVA